MRQAGYCFPIAVILAGCLGGAQSALPSPPPVPAGWTSVEKSGLRMVLPPEWPMDAGWDDIVVNVGVGDPNVFLLGVAPTRVEQPESHASAAALADWILDRISTTRPDEYSTADVRLPAGPAVMVQFHFDGDAGNVEAVEGVAYAITTAKGIAYLQINMSASLLDEFGDAMAEVPLHVMLADAAG